MSPAGGELPTWSPTRREIIYDRDGELMVTSYAVDGARFKVGVTRPWPGSRHETRGRNRMFDVHPDGERVVLARAKTPSDGGANRAAQFVFNFFEELQRLAPTRAR